MNIVEEPDKQAAWSRMSYAQKNKVLYERQVALLQLFLEKHAMTVLNMRRVLRISPPNSRRCKKRSQP